MKWPMILIAGLAFLSIEQSFARVIAKGDCSDLLGDSTTVEIEGRTFRIPNHRQVKLVRPSEKKLQAISQLASQLPQHLGKISVNDLAKAMEDSNLVFNSDDVNFVRIAAREQFPSLHLSTSHFFSEVPGILPAVFLESEPTPIRPLAMPSESVGFLKDDSQLTRQYGGNKPRKLEFLLGDAIAEGASHIITTGGLGSNHTVATAALGKALGLKVIVVLSPQFETEELRKNILATQALGAEIVYVKDRAKAVEKLTTTLLASGQHPYVVPGGGKSALGEIGWVNAAFELKNEIDAGIVPEPKEIWIPSGTGGSASGLVLGLRLAHIHSRLIVVDVSGGQTRREIANTANATLSLLKRHMYIDPGIDVSESDFDLIEDVGQGFGIPTESAQVAAFLNANPGFKSEDVFMNKTIGVLLKTDLSRFTAASPLLYWSTFNGQELPKGNFNSLPKEVRDVLQNGRRTDG